MNERGLQPEGSRRLGAAGALRSGRERCVESQASGTRRRFPAACFLPGQGGIQFRPTGGVPGAGARPDGGRTNQGFAGRVAVALDRTGARVSQAPDEGHYRKYRQIRSSKRTDQGPGRNPVADEFWGTYCASLNSFKF